jgi:tetratricopeptide (TPR) repeat protein
MRKTSGKKLHLAKRPKSTGGHPDQLLLLSILFGISVALTASPLADSCRQGFAALQSGNPQGAEQLLTQCVATNPNQIQPYLALCGIYQSQGKTEELFRTAESGLKRFPGEQRFYLTVGNHLGRKEEYDQAIPIFEEANRRWPGDAQVKEGLANTHLYRGMQLLEKNKNQEAETHLRRAAKLAENDVDAHLNLGRALHNLSRGTEAVAEFDKVITLDPKTPLGWFHRGMVLHSLGELDPAIADLTVEIRQNPDYPPSYFFRGRAYFTKGLFAEALADLDVAVRKMPGNPKALFERGRCYNQLGRTAEAEADFRKAAQLEPDNPEPLNALGRLLWLSGKKEEGEALFEKAREKSQARRVVTPGEIRFEGAEPPRHENTKKTETQRQTK